MTNNNYFHNLGCFIVRTNGQQARIDAIEDYKNEMSKRDTIKHA